MSKNEEKNLQWRREAWFYRTFDEVEYCCLIDMSGNVIYKMAKSTIVSLIKTTDFDAMQRELLLQAMCVMKNFENIVFVGWKLWGLTFRDINFYGCHFTQCNFQTCRFLRCNIDHVVISKSTFCACRFGKSYMGFANIADCDFTGSEFLAMFLTGTIFLRTCLERTEICRCDTEGAKMKECDLLYMVYDSTQTAAITMENCNNPVATHGYIPSHGMFTAWKVIFKEDGAACLIELRVPTNAKRFSSIAGSGRAQFAKVVRIMNLDTFKTEDSVMNKRFTPTLYVAGKIVKPDRWSIKPEHCSNGIHFYIDPGYAVFLRSPQHYKVWDTIKETFNI